jgi:5-enolpyruvylshikimate-3-phosphate synthase
MSLGMAATIASDEVIIRDVDNVDTSFPGFCACVAGIGGEIEVLHEQE